MNVSVLGKVERASELWAEEEKCLAQTHLAQSGRGNADWQHDVAASYARLADVHQQLEDNAKALDYLRQGQTIMTRLTKLSPENAIWAQDLAWFNTRIAELGSKKA